MLNSPMLNTVICLVFTYALFALLVSTIMEAWASAMKTRANGLLAGIKKLLNDKEFNGLALSVYNHAMVNPLSAGDIPAGAKNNPSKMPSYIDANNFALALLDSIGAIKDGALQKSAQDLDSKITDPQIRKFVDGILQRSNTSVDKAKAEIASWFDASMDRLSGEYKRRSQLLGFFVAFVIAMSMNIDSVSLFRMYWQQPSLQLALTTSAGAAAAEAVRQSNLDKTSLSTPLTSLYALPIGWKSPATHEIAEAVPGCLLTALSVLFGAPFWFGLLQNLVNIRGTGNKPITKPAKS